MFGWVADDFARQTRREGPGSAIVFGLFWWLILGFVCVVLVAGTARQVVSAGWPTADGTVTVSEHAGRRKTGAAWNLAYEYTIAGRQYTGTTYAYDPMPIQGYEEVARHITIYPVGAAVIVYYDPENPTDAVLRPGLRGCTLWVSLFLTPFVLIGLGMWIGAARRYWARPAFNPSDARHVAVIDTGTLIIRPERTHWLTTFLTYLGMTTFLVGWALFFLGFGLGAAYWLFDGFLLDPPVAVPACVWGAVLVGCALATRRSLRRAPVLILDTFGRVLQFFSAGNAPV